MYLSILIFHYPSKRSTRNDAWLKYIFTDMPGLNENVLYILYYMKYLVLRVTVLTSIVSLEAIVELALVHFNLTQAQTYTALLQL